MAFKKENKKQQKAPKWQEKLLEAWIFVQEIPQKPILTNSIILIILTITLISLSLPYWSGKAAHEEYLHSVLIEAHGMILDLFIIGILLLWLNKKGEKQQRIRRYLDEIDDFRFWKSEEAAYRTMGNIKRLNRDGIFKIDMNSAYLVNTNLNNVILKESNLNSANMSGSHINGSDFMGARLNQANLENTHLHNANFEDAYLSGTSFKGSSMIKANLKKSNCMMANFEGAILMEADLEGANFLGANFKNANLYKANLKGAKGLQMEQLKEAKSLYKAILDDKFIEKIKEEAPNLLFENE